MQKGFSYCIDYTILNNAQEKSHLSVHGQSVLYILHDLSAMKCLTLFQLCTSTMLYSAERLNLNRSTATLALHCYYTKDNKPSTVSVKRALSVSHTAVPVHWYFCCGTRSNMASCRFFRHDRQHAHIYP